MSWDVGYVNNNKKLTLHQKMIITRLLHYEGEFNHYIKEESYGDTAAWEILERWLSEILDVDFKKDICNNSDITHFNKQEHVIKMLKESGDNSWWIGDNLKGQLTSFCWKDGTTESMTEVEQNIKETWKKFLDLYKPVQDCEKTEILYHMETGEIYLVDMSRIKLDLQNDEVVVILETEAGCHVGNDVNLQEFGHIGWL